MGNQQAKTNADLNVCGIEFDHRASGLGESVVAIEITHREAVACVEHWCEMLWAVESNWACGASGSWENAMWAYANDRVEQFVKPGLLTEKTVGKIRDAVYNSRPSLESIQNPAQDNELDDLDREWLSDRWDDLEI